MRNTITFIVRKESGNATVLLLPRKESGKYSFVNLTKGHICPCQFDTVEDAIKDMEERRQQGLLTSYEQIGPAAKQLYAYQRNDGSFNITVVSQISSAQAESKGSQEHSMIGTMEIPAGLIAITALKMPDEDLPLQTLTILTDKQEVGEDG